MIKKWRDLAIWVRFHRPMIGGKCMRELSLLELCTLLPALPGHQHLKCHGCRTRFFHPDLSDLQKSYTVMFTQGVCVRESLRGIGDLKDQFWGSLGDWFFRRLVPWLLESLVTDSVRLDACSLLSWRGTSKKSDRDALAATIQVQLWAELLRGYIPYSYYGNTGPYFSLIVQAGENEKLCEW